MGIVVVLAGLAVGSFLNVCIDRLPARQSLLRPRSHCDACKTPLATRDLIPVVSYLLLRGKCRHCSTPIPLRVPLVEAGTALGFLRLVVLPGGIVADGVRRRQQPASSSSPPSSASSIALSLNRMRRTGHGS